jgi:hypothetical protein
MSPPGHGRTEKRPGRHGYLASGQPPGADPPWRLRSTFGCVPWAGIMPTLCPRLLYPSKAVALVAAAKVFSPVPRTDPCAAANWLFDHRVGAQHEPGRNLMADRFCGLEIYDQLKCGRLFYREISGLRAAQYFGELPSHLPI